MNSIGERLREERKRLGLSQDALCQIGGVQRRAQVNYEADERQPDAAYLAAVAAAGVDVLYVLTGSRDGPPPPTPKQAFFLRALEAAPEALQDAALRVLLQGGGPPRQEQVFHGEVGQAIKVEGNLDQAGLSFFGKTKKSKK